MKFLLLISAILVNVVSYCILKSVSGKSFNMVWLGKFSLGIILAGVTTFLFTLALKGLGLTVAYSVFCGGSIALIMVASLLLFQESIIWTNYFGVVVIIIGIVMVTIK